MGLNCNEHSTIPFPVASPLFNHNLKLICSQMQTVSENWYWLLTNRLLIAGFIRKQNRFTWIKTLKHYFREGMSLRYKVVWISVKKRFAYDLWTSKFYSAKKDPVWSHEEVNYRKYVSYFFLQRPAKTQLWDVKPLRLSELFYAYHTKTKSMIQCNKRQELKQNCLSIELYFSRKGVQKYWLGSCYLFRVYFFFRKGINRGTLTM